ncbi:MAG: hypothetical protein HN742_28650 [Lentisphaerae bacterium]|jgi:hypothetical protein|nr:hypothetical protein [Lentisphaerota bacterium]MBT4817837.1 hypothetical protein [Lentisphaerota bacterium]MBT5612234.1 hypothetical protein [Lentisphaerota bacterium]MBT7845877.1 hypothetical protein [Lentisphaerota bacterium]
MCHEGDEDQPVPSGSRTEVHSLIARLHAAQQAATERIQAVAAFDTLDHATPDGFTVNDTLRMWVWHFSTHYRDLVRARGPLTGDDPHFHVPHFVRQAHEEFGKFIGELACLDDEYLDARPPDGGRTVRESVEHVLDTLTDYFAPQIEQAVDAEPEPSQR